MEDVYGERIMGYRHRGPYRKPLAHFIVYSCWYLKAVFWVETKGKTLEEIDAIFEGEKHSTVPDVEMVRKGKAQIDVGAIEHEIDVEVEHVKMKENWTKSMANDGYNFKAECLFRLLWNWNLSLLLCEEIQINSLVLHMWQLGRVYHLTVFTAQSGATPKGTVRCEVTW